MNRYRPYYFDPWKQQGYDAEMRQNLTGEYVRFEDAERLCQELSLAEEGLANYAQEVEQLRSALKRFGAHRITCPISDAFPQQEGQAYVCTCGFETATMIGSPGHPTGDPAALPYTK